MTVLNRQETDLCGLELIARQMSPAGLITTEHDTA